ncbi:ubiquitin carboxy terminal hydrolase Ubp11 [Schizosaccharomyces japonicus yFS275]|uniref:Ubiquitin carboxy terminal hydrolase Ubp11 n=1 Tax=Schizosaccharomyces japonicus (strain yFS275 / FY16936) TaxID=402676 RepID=B6K0B8_SCHJY|nr:ubiquitin carboxy terminal hydrolase Ubp11 [Schizosaccharomyces japonicus yFS275]EEB06268.2 ubiquitin carboxy terminal hydrolase Ubp11 [Schizosaccharomyces japonicus yFS275]
MAVKGSRSGLKMLLTALTATGAAAGLWLLIQPSQSRKVTGDSKVVGLYNATGNDCFINCIVQALASLESLLDVLRSRKSFTPLNEALEEILHLLNGQTNRTQNVNKLVLKLNYAIGRSIQRSRQQDAHEFLQCLLETLQNQPRTTQFQALKQCYKVPFPWPFIGRMRQRVTCGRCLSVSDTYFSTLSLELSLPPESISKSWNNLSLSQLLQQNASDSIEGYHCTNCSKKRRVVNGSTVEPTSCTRSLTWTHLPSILILFLQRSYYDPHRGLERNNCRINYPRKLHASDTDARSYVLKAVVVHRGSPSFGHYSCYRTALGSWWLTSDSQTRKVSMSSVLDQSQKVCILFYERESFIAGVDP